MKKWPHRTVAGSVLVACLALEWVGHNIIGLVLGAALFLFIAVVRPA
jgi:hypothetical protein